MKLRALSLCVAAAAAGLSFSSGAWATDGYFSDGYGMKASGRGGAAMGFTTDAFGGANNPASMVWVGNRLDVGVTLFMPQRGASRTGSAGSMGPGDPGRDFNENSDRRNFPIPEFGYNHMLGSDMSLGLDVYGNGGLNTYYHNNAITNGGCGAPGNRNNLCGQGRLGVNLLQAIIAPTFAIKLTPIMSIGISPLFGVQSFKAQGLQAFQAPGFSIAPNQITNKGTDYSYGYGGRIGYMIKPLHWLTLGAAYSTKVYMSPINRYAGLFAQGGKLDIPANWSAGFAIKPVKGFTFGADFERILYNQVRAIHNPSTNMAQLGSDNGPGFGWQSVNVIKVGMEIHPVGPFTVRLGYNHSTNPVQSRDVTFNILAPGVVKDHATFGVTYDLTHKSELTLAYMHAFRNTVSGNSLLLGGQEKIYMFQNSIGVAFGHRF